MNESSNAGQDSESDESMNEVTRCGYVAIVGRPNVGKSTLLNHMLGQKISITSRKPQTTRHQLLGIKTSETTQCVFVDTPGLHRQHDSNAVNRYMNRAARSVIDDVDLVLFMVDRLTWGEEEDWIAELLQKSSAPVMLLINKIDQLARRDALLPFIQGLQERYVFKAYLPIAALNGEYLEELEREIVQYLPESPFHFPEDQITDKTERFMVAEIVREKLIRQLGRELPYETAVEIEHFKPGPKILDIAANIYVERAGQKAIIIGKDGSRLNQIGRQAREDLEQMFEQKVMLRLWVKIKQGWSNDERSLKSLGFED